LQLKDVEFQILKSYILHLKSNIKNLLSPKPARAEGGGAEPRKGKGWEAVEPDSPTPPLGWRCPLIQWAIGNWQMPAAQI
jgi:hypothetical protein